MFDNWIVTFTKPNGTMQVVVNSTRKSSTLGAVYVLELMVRMIWACR